MAVIQVCFPFFFVARSVENSFGSYTKSKNCLNVKPGANYDCFTGNLLYYLFLCPNRFSKYFKVCFALNICHTHNCFAISNCGCCWKKPVANQCSKLLPVRQPEADNFGGGPGTFLKLFFNFMFMIWDSRQQDWQLFWLSFEHWANTLKKKRFTIVLCGIMCSELKVLRNL